MNMELSLTIKLSNVSETLAAPPPVRTKGKIIQVRAKASDAPVAVCALCRGEGKRGEYPCHKCNGEKEFPSEYLLRINGYEDETILEEARNWATSRGLRVTSKLILKENVNGQKAMLVCKADGSRLNPSDRLGTVYTFRALVVQITERPEPDTAVGKIDLVEIREHRSHVLPLFLFRTTDGKLDPTKDVEILPDAIRTSKFFPDECVTAALKGEKWSSIPSR